jgi:glycosyltransferase involved in cell wall biosynthesis
MKTKGSILIITQYFYPENFRVNDLAISLMRDGWKIDVLTGIPNYPTGKFFSGYSRFKPLSEDYNGIRVIRTPLIARGKSRIQLILNYLSFVLSSLIRLQGLKSKDYDVVFLYEVSPMIQGLVAVRAKKIFGAPLISYLLDLWPENYSTVTGDKKSLIVRKMRQVTQKIVQSSEHILVPSNGFKMLIESQYSTDGRVEVWPQYAEEYYRSIPKIRSKKPYLNFVYTGNVGQAQNLQLIIDAINLMSVKDKELLSFTIVGEGSDKSRLIEYVDRKKLTNVFFKDAIPPEEISELMSHYDVGFLSLQNSVTANITIPAKFQSYMATGTPVFAIIDGETANIINEHQLGWIESSYDICNISKLLSTILRLSRSDLMEYEKRCVDFSSSNYDKFKLLARLEEILMEVL